MNYCPFCNGECRDDCVFRINQTAVDAETVTACRLVSTSATLEYLSDIIITEKEQH